MDKSCFGRSLVFITSRNKQVALTLVPNERVKFTDNYCYFEYYVERCSLAGVVKIEDGC